MNNRGFTILEMVIAISIFAIIAAISYTALDGFLDARARINAENDEMKQLQNVFVLLGRDLRYAVNRPVRDEYGDAEPAFVGSGAEAPDAGERLRLTTLRPSASQADTQHVVRVAWRLEDGELSRATWRVLDRDLDSEPYQRRLMRGVQDLGLRFFSYPDEENVDIDAEWTGGASLPAGVEVTLLLTDGTAYQRVFQIGGGEAGR